MEPGTPSAFAPRSSGCSNTPQPETSACAFKTDTAKSTNKLASSTFPLFLPASRGKPRKKLADRRAGGPGRLLQRALEKVEHGGDATTMAYPPALTSCRSLLRRAGFRKSLAGFLTTSTSFLNLKRTPA